MPFASGVVVDEEKGRSESSMAMNHSSSKTNNISDDTREPPPKRCDITTIDIYAYNPSHTEYVKPHQSLVGTLATIATTILCAIIIVNSIQRFRNDEIERSIQPRSRTDEDAAEIGTLGMILFYDGKPFYNERLFRINYRYRAIYNGDTENDVRPRVYLDIPSKTCLLYNDDNSPGKNATLGCPDREAARRLLAAEKERLLAAAINNTNDNNTKVNDDITNFPVVPVTMGQYGSDAYWFLEVKLNDCTSYGEAANITCANSTERQDIFAKGLFNFDFVMSSQISTTESLWKNLYMEIEQDRWTGVETYFLKTHSFETDRLLHRTTRNHVNYSSFDSLSFRTNHRRDGDPFYTFYIRLQGEVNEEKLAHYALLDAATEVGGAWEVVIIFMTFGFVGFNCLAYYHHLQARNFENENVEKRE